MEYKNIRGHRSTKRKYILASNLQIQIVSQIENNKSE